MAVVGDVRTTTADPSATAVTEAMTFPSPTGPTSWPVPPEPLRQRAIAVMIMAGREFFSPLLAILMVLWLISRLRWHPRTSAAFLLAALPLSLSLLSCDHESHRETIEQATANAPISPVTSPSALETTRPATSPRTPGPALELLATHGPFTLYGEPRPLAHGTDGFRQFSPHLFFGDKSLPWPFETPPDLSGPLHRRRTATFHPLPRRHPRRPAPYPRWSSFLSRRRGHQDHKPGIFVHRCLLPGLYREHERGQTLDVLRLNTNTLRELPLGSSLGCAPVVAPDGREVIWADTPQDHAALRHYSFLDSREPRTIVNPGVNRDLEDLEPFPVGVHTPIWLSEGIAFESENALILIDTSGQLLATASSEHGMFYDSATGKL